MADNVERVALVFDENGSGKFIQSLKDVNLELNKNYNAFKLNQAQWDESTTKIQKLREEQEYLTNAYELQNNKIILLKEELSKLENAEDKNTTQIKRKRNELLNAQIQLEKYSKRIEKTETALSNAEKGIKSTSEKIEELTQKMKENDLAFELTKSKYTSMTTLTTKLKDEQNYLTNSYKLQEEKIELLNEQLEELNTVEDKNAEAISRKKQEILSAEASLQRYQNQINEVNIKISTGSEKIKEYGKNLENAGNIINKAGNKVSAFSVASLTALTAATKGAISFESAFTGVEKTVDATDEELAQLKKDIRQMAKEIPASTTEISAVAEAAGQLGIKTKDIMNFTRTMIDLGNSTNLSAEEAASSLAKFANVTKMSADEYSNLGSTIVALGNNFATTEKDIVEMATKLAATGELTGLTQSQILALATSMSSVGIEAEAGGSAMSKLLKEIKVATETGSKKLDKFSKVAGMTSEEFKKAFQEDSVKALSLFIKGLNDTERNGKSAIAILDDMGLTEVRLSNTILSLANSNDLMNDAVELANKSWKENNALNQEASKRYETLESKITTSISKLKDIGITVGEKVMPIVEKFINKLDDWSKKFESLNDEQVETIVKIGALVAAAGPALKILGNITSGAGNVVKGIASISETTGLLMNKITGSSTVMEGFFGTLQKISSITSPFALAIVGATTAMAISTSETRKLTEEQEKLIEANNKLIENANNQQSSYDELKKKKQEYLDTNLSEIQYVQNLYDEMQNIVDENGKIKTGYEERVKFILGQLNSALGTEYTLNGNIVNSYKNIQGEIQKTINLRKAEIIVDQEKNAWENAIANQEEAYTTLEKLNKEYSNTSDEIENLEVKVMKYSKAFDDAKEKLDFGEMEDASKNYNKYKNQLTEMLETQTELDTEIDQQQELIKGYAYDIATYEADSARLLSGTEEDINEILNKTSFTYKSTTKDIGEEIAKQIKLEQDKYETYKQLYDEQVKLEDETAASVYKTQMDSQQKVLNTLGDTLVKQTQMLGTEGPNIKEAWRVLAESNLTVYTEKIGKIPSEMGKIVDDAINETVIHFDDGNGSVVSATENLTNNVNAEIENNLNIQGIVEGELSETTTKIQGDTTVSNAANTLTNNVNTEIKSNLNISGIVEGELSATTTKIQGDTTVPNAANNLAASTKNSFKNGTNGNKWGQDLIDEVRGGLQNQSKLRLLANAAKGVANVIARFIHFSLPEEGPLSDLDESMPDMIDLMVDGLKKNEGKLENETKKIAGNMKDNLSIDPLEQKANQITQSVNSNLLSKDSAFSNNLIEDILYRAFLKALNNCKMIFDRDGFTKFIDNRLMEVM